MYRRGGRDWKGREERRKRKGNREEIVTERGYDKEVKENNDCTEEGKRGKEGKEGRERGKGESRRRKLVKLLFCYSYKDPQEFFCLLYVI